MLQVVETRRFSDMAADFRQNVIVLPAQRGNIYDRNGHTLATTVDLQMLFADPSEIVNTKKTAVRLAPVLGMNERALRGMLRPTPATSEYEVITHEIDNATAAKVAKLGLFGVYLTPEPKRTYPGDRLASHLLGFVRSDGVALEGIELQYDAILKGTPGKETYEDDPSGVHLPQADSTYVAPQQGRSLYLTIDKEIQFFTEDALATAAATYHAKSASAIVMDVRSGEILALANVPDFDPNRFGDFVPDELRNRAVTDFYEPGSVFKAVTAAAALEEGIATPETTYSVPDEIQVSDRVIHDSHEHPEEVMTFTDIIADSSNVGTVKIGIELGKDRLDKWIHRFGFGQETGLGFPGESPGLVQDPDDWYGSTISQVPLGQGIAVTPIQLVAAYGAIANSGMWVEPKLVHGMLDPDGDIVPATPPTRHRVISKETSQRLLEILTEVVERGTGVEAQVPGYLVAGKTGTAQKALPQGGYGDIFSASFLGIAPADHPEIVILVTFDEPTPNHFGGSTAAPTFQKIATFVLNQLGIAPTANAEQAFEQSQHEEDPVVHD